MDRDYILNCLREVRDEGRCNMMDVNCVVDQLLIMGYDDVAEEITDKQINYVEVLMELK